MNYAYYAHFLPTYEKAAVLSSFLHRDEPYAVIETMNRGEENIIIVVDFEDIGLIGGGYSICNPWGNGKMIGCQEFDCSPGLTYKVIRKALALDGEQIYVGYNAEYDLLTAVRSYEARKPQA